MTLFYNEILSTYPVISTMSSSPLHAVSILIPRFETEKKISFLPVADIEDIRFKKTCTDGSMLDFSWSA